MRDRDDCVLVLQLIILSLVTVDKKLSISVQYEYDRSQLGVRFHNAVHNEASRLTKGRSDSDLSTGVQHKDKIIHVKQRRYSEESTWSGWAEEDKITAEEEAVGETTDRAQDMALVHGRTTQTKRS